MKTLEQEKALQFDSQLGQLLSKAPSKVHEIPPSPSGFLVATLADWRTGTPFVEFDGNPAGEPVPARTCVELTASHIDRKVVMCFEANDLRRPLIMGLLHGDVVPKRSDLRVIVDGERVTVDAEKEIVLRCGEASITLTRAGKVLIKGTYILSRSSGYNKLKGAAIDLN